MKNRTVCFTGHRVLPVSEKEEISRKLRNVIESLIKTGYCYFGAGGALGFDTLASELILDLKSEYPHIKLILVLPYFAQAKGWNEYERKHYEEIKRQADKVVYTSDGYTKGCFHKRNRHLVDNSSMCICYLTENRGGTYYTVNYAKKKALQIINIAIEN